MKRLLLIIVIALLGAVSCYREETTAPVAGNCELKIDFGTGFLRTKAGDGNVADGGGIYIDDSDPDNLKPDLVILVVNNSSGNVVGWYPDPVPDSGVDSKLETGADETAMSVTFTSLTEGAHTVYAFANTGGYWAMEGQGANDADEYLLSLTTKSAIDALRFSDLFATVDASVCPYDESNSPDRLPLSAKGTVNVSSEHTGEVSLEMLRCVAKVTAEFINNTGDALTLYDYSNTIVGMCPSRGYVIAGEPDYPAGTLQGNIIATESSLSIPKNDPQDSSKPGTKTMTWYVFPSSGPYTCDIAFTLFKNESNEHTYTYSDLPVHDDHAVSIPSLARNRHLHIVTKISQGTTVSFNFEVAGWGEPLVEQVSFN